MKITEFLNKGLVQTRHPMLLDRGELQTATNTVYRPDDPSIHRMWGRTSFGKVSTYEPSITVAGTVLTYVALGGGPFATAVTLSTQGVDGDYTLTSSGGWSGANEGDAVWGTNITAGTYITKKPDSNTVFLSLPCTGNTTTTVYYSTIHTDAYVRFGTESLGIVATVDTATQLTMDATVPSYTTGAHTVVIASPINSLKFASFSAQETNLILAKTGPTIYYAGAGSTTGTFASLYAGYALDEKVEMVGYNNKYALLGESRSPRVCYYPSDANTPSTREMGMQPVLEDDIQGLTLVSPGQFPSADEGYGPGRYWFVVTEIMEVDDGSIIEGTYDGAPLPLDLEDDTAQGIEVHYSNRVNDGSNGRNTATGWRVYMTKQIDDTGLFEIPPLSLFYLVGEADTATNSVVLNQSVYRRAGYPTAALAASGLNSPFNDTQVANLLGATSGSTLTACVLTEKSSTITAASGLDAPVSGSYLVSPDNDIPEEGKFVSKNSATTAGCYPPAEASNADVDLWVGCSPPPTAIASGYSSDDGTSDRGVYFHSFDFGNAVGGFQSSTTIGVTVYIQTRGYFPRAVSQNTKVPSMSVRIVADGQTGTYSAAKVRNLRSAYQIFGLGSGRDDWGLALSPSVFDNSADGSTKFGVEVKIHPSHNLDGPQSYVFDIYKIWVRLTADGTEISPNNKPFDTVTLSDQIGTAQDYAAAFPPPTATTGDHFNGIFVTNDVSEKNIVVGSLPNDEEKFPIPYRIPIQSESNDNVIALKRLGKILIIGMENSIKRMNYFPLETDSDFNRGRCYEDIASDHGVVSPESMCIIDLPGRGTALAYLSHRGLYWTDGINTYPLSTDIDWRTLFGTIGNSVLRNYPRNHCIALYYTPTGETYNTKVLYFYYHPSLLKEGGKLPATGPNRCFATSADSGMISGINYHFTGHTFYGQCYREDDGTVTPEYGNVPQMTIRTRRLLLGGPGHQGRVDGLALLVDADGDGTTGGFDSNLYIANNDSTVALDSTWDEESTANGGQVDYLQNLFGDAADLEIDKDGSGTQTADFRLHWAMLHVKPYGESQSDA